MFKARYRVILMLVLLMVAGIYILDVSIQTEKAVYTPSKLDQYVQSLPSESGVFERGNGQINFEEMSLTNQKSLDEYYENRAYPGAPPTIPHELLSEKGIGGNSCLQCHQNGGYVDRFKAYAPISPHTDLTNCRQCHVPVKTTELFRKTTWRKTPHPDIGGATLPGSPPPIPHDLQMRENCLSCHAGPAIPKEIRVSHSERANCRQCHATTTSFKIVWDSIPLNKPKIQWENLSQ